MKNKHSRIWAAVFMSILIAVSTVLTAVGHIDKAQAAEKAVLQVSTVSGHRGDEVSVTVSLTSNPGIAGLVFSLTFDNKVLKLVDVKEPANTDDEFIFYEPIIKDDAINDTSINYIGYAFASGKSNITKTGIVYTATFKILDEAAIGTTQLNIAGRNGQDTADVSSIDEKAVPIEVTAGSVTVTCEHKHTETMKTAATCTKDGLEVVTCKDCKEVISSTVLKSTGHKYGDWIVDKAVTCTEDGEEYRECSVCHNKITQKIEHKGHVAGTPEVTKEPTCTKDGVKSYICKRCGDVKTEVLPATGHTYDEGKITKEPTETEEGMLVRTCTRCGETETIALPKLDKNKVKLETSEGSEFTGVITAGKDNNVILSVIGMNYAVPNGGDVRYVPVRWSFAAANQEIKWNNITDSNYSINLNSAEAGDYKLVVEYKREMYKTLADGTKGWVASDSALAASTYVAETTLKVEEKQSSDDTKEDVKPEDTTKDDNNNNDSEVTEGVKTGDMSVNIAVLMMMLMLMSGTAVIYTGKSGKAR